MSRFPKRFFLAAACSTLVLTLFAFPALAETPKSAANLPPTVTAKVGGTTVTVRSDEPQYNVRSGPSTTDYPVIGSLTPGQSVLVKGRSPGGEWIQIYFPGVPGNVGWVATMHLNIPLNVSIPVSEPPPTPMPKTTSTVDPTLAAQFLTTPLPTRLPTFTQPAPLVIPTLPPAQSPSGQGGVPMGMVIVILAGLGAFLGLVSLIRGR